MCVCVCVCVCVSVSDQSACVFLYACLHEADILPPCSPTVKPANVGYPLSRLACGLGISVGGVVPRYNSSGGAAPNNFTVSPALPTGLRLDPTTGVISGVPTVSSALTSYTITVCNSGGCAPDVILSISVSGTCACVKRVFFSPSKGLSNPTLRSDGVPLFGICSMVSLCVCRSFTSCTVLRADAAAVPAVSYAATQPITWTLNAALPTPVVPTVNSGIVESWSISPPLPSGVTFNLTTGVMDGTPTVWASMLEM